MKKKLIIIISLVVLIAIISVIVISSIIRARKTNYLFDNSNYPITYVIKDGSIVMQIDGRKTEKLKWEVSVDDEEIVQVTGNSKESGGKVEYTITPVKSGITKVRFAKNETFGDDKINMALINIPVHVVATNNGLIASPLENCYLVEGPDVIGDGTDYPVLFYDKWINTVYGTGVIEETADFVFPNGLNDWVLTSVDGHAAFDYIDNDGIVEIYVKKGYDPSGIEGDVESDDSGSVNIDVDMNATPTDIMSITNSYNTSEVTGTELTLSSASLGISQKISVTYDEEGEVHLSLISSK